MNHVLDVTNRFMEIINDLEFSHRFISLNNFSIPGDQSGEPPKGYLGLIPGVKFGERQKDILDDDLLLLFSLSS
jgi:hypothetical protein